VFDIDPLIDGVLDPVTDLGHRRPSLGIAQVSAAHPRRVRPDHPLSRQGPAMAGASYEIRIRGRLSAALLDSFEGMASDLEPVETVLHGPVRDQSQLHGLINRIQALGLELIEVRRLPSQEQEREDR
jgi:hypothetical protein